MSAERQERIQGIERQISYLSDAVESLKSRIEEIESLQTYGLSVSILQATKVVFKPILIRLRATTKKSEEEIDEELSLLIEGADSDIGKFFKLIMSPSLAVHVSGETDTLVRPKSTPENEKLLKTLESRVQLLEKHRDKEKSFSNQRKSDLEERLKESLSKLAELRNVLSKLKPLEISEVPAARLSELGRKLGHAGLSTDSLAEKILENMPSNLARDFRATELLATAMQSKEKELLLISSVVESDINSLAEGCSGCLLSKKDCRCPMLDRVTLTLDRLLENTPESSSSLIQKNWLKFYPYFYLNPLEAAQTMRLGIPDSTTNLTPYLTEVIARLLFGDLLNPHWFKSDIEASRSSSSERMNLNRWIKSVTRLSIGELSEILGNSVPALSRDHELPIAWLLSVTNGAREFSESLEIFLQAHLEQSGH